MINALSIDLEEWYHPELVKGSIKTERFSQINEAVLPITDLLDKYNIRATFFVLGEVAKGTAGLIKKIYSKGHEIASHGMDHTPLWGLTRQSFAKQLDDFQALIREVIGDSAFQIKGFRAPSFSLDDTTSWALEVLKEKGYKYDSSIFPFKNRLYGVNGAPLGIYQPSFADLRKSDPDCGIIEFPLAAYEALGVRIPSSGGFYLRTIPFLILRNLLKQINKTRPFVFYLHPWETYKYTPRVKGLAPMNYLITYWGISGVLKKLEVLLKIFSFRPICEVLDV